jgi:hypothetical protein
MQLQSCGGLGLSNLLFAHRNANSQVQALDHRRIRPRDDIG